MAWDGDGQQHSVRPADAHAHVSTSETKAPRSDSEFEEHVVVHVPEREKILDLDLGHWIICSDCPGGVGFKIPAAAALSWPTGALGRRWPGEDGTVIKMIACPEQTHFLGNDYWTKPSPEAIKKLVRMIRKGGGS